MVDKIMSKDKNYNMYVSKVVEKENKMDIMKKDIKRLEEHYQRLRNDCNHSIINLFQNFNKIFISKYEI